MPVFAWPKDKDAQLANYRVAMGLRARTVLAFIGVFIGIMGFLFVLDLLNI